MTDQQVEPPGKADHPLKELQRRDSAGRIVGVVQPQDSSRTSHLGRDRIQIREEPIFGHERKTMNHTTRKQGTHRIGKVTRIRHQDRAARVDEGQCYIDDAFFRP